MLGILAEQGATLRQLFKELAGIFPACGGNFAAIAVFQAGQQQAQQIAGLLREVMFLEVARGAAGFEAFGPFAQQLRLVVLDCFDCAVLQCCHVRVAPIRIGGRRSEMAGAN